MVGWWLVGGRGGAPAGIMRNMSESAFCPHCGGRTTEHVPGCAADPAAPAVTQGEQTLLAFGPFGYEHCFGRPGLFVWMQKNNTEFVFTDRRLCGMRRGKVLFEIPLGWIGNLQVFPFMLGRALWVQYWDGSSWKELSILGAALCHAQIDRAHELLRGLVRPPEVAPPSAG